MRALTHCIGDGTDGAGCGYTQGRSGDTCPRCGGMVLSARALREADALQQRMDAEQQK